MDISNVPARRQQRSFLAFAFARKLARTFVLRRGAVRLAHCLDLQSDQLLLHLVSAMASIEYNAVFAPYGVLACAELGGLGATLEKKPRKDMKPNEPPKLTAGGVRFEGTATSLRWAARAGSQRAKLFREDCAVAATQVDQWIDWSCVMKPGQALPALLKSLNAFLASRAFLVGDALTLADLAIWGTLSAMPLWEQKLKKDKALGRAILTFRSTTASNC